MKACCVPGCGRPVAVKKHGLCSAHYKRYWRGGDVREAKIQSRPKPRLLAPFKGGKG